MKECPECYQEYSDREKFCSVDGTALVPMMLLDIYQVKERLGTVIAMAITG